MAEIYDLIIIGGGPGGYAASISAAKNGKKVLLFENGDLGGTCLNVGCIPTKYLLEKAKIIHEITTLTNQGILKEAGLYSFKKIQEGKSQTVKKLVGGVSALLKTNGVTVIQKQAELQSGHTVLCDGTTYQAQDIIIATGSAPGSIPVPGIEHAIDSTGALSLKSPPTRMAIIGGGVIGMELASAYQAFGTQVTVVEMLDEFFPNEEKTLVKMLVSELKKSGIRLISNARISRIQKTAAGFELQYMKDGQPNVLTADIVLSATGRKPALRGIDAKKLGIRLGTRGEILVNEYLQTSLPHVYAIGDVIGGYQLAHAAYAEAECAVSSILGEKKRMDYTVMPRCIFTFPNYAAVGMTSQEALKEGHKTITGSFNYAANGMALSKGAVGMITVVADQETEETLGVHILGEGAPEMVSAATIAIKNQMTLSQWKELIIAHPSLSEMLREAALDCIGSALHKI